MVLNDWKDKVMGMFSHKAGTGTHRPDGGTSCYRPLKRRTAQEPAQGQEADQQSMAYIHTGFTGSSQGSSARKRTKGHSDSKGRGKILFSQITRFYVF